MSFRTISRFNIRRGWPKFSLKSGIIASVFGALVAISLPFIYDHFGDGARVTREAVLKSAEIQKACGTIGNFYIVPWGLSLQESDLDGQLEIAYWFNCGPSHGTVDAKYHHKGGPWIADSIVAHLGTRSFDLMHEQP